MIPVTATPTIQISPVPVQGTAAVVMPVPSAAGQLPYSAVPPTVSNVRPEERPYQPPKPQSKSQPGTAGQATNTAQSGSLSQGAFRDTGSALHPLPSSGFLAQLLSQVGQKVGMESLQFSFPISEYEHVLGSPRQTGHPITNSNASVRGNGIYLPDLPAPTKSAPARSVPQYAGNIKLPDSPMHSVKISNIDFLTTLSQSSNNIAVSGANGTAAYHYGHQKVQFTPSSDKDNKRSGSISATLSSNAYISAMTLAGNTKSAAI